MAKRSYLNQLARLCIHLGQYIQKHQSKMNGYLDSSAQTNLSNLLAQVNAVRADLIRLSGLSNYPFETP